LHNGGCEISKYTAMLALYYNRVECIKYIFNNSNLFAKHKSLRSSILLHRNEEISDYAMIKLNKKY